MLVSLDSLLLYNGIMAKQREFKSNNNVVYSCTYHVVFCPKYRRKVLVNGVDERLKAIIRQVADETQSEVLELEVMPDHVHLLCEVAPQFSDGTFCTNSAPLWCVGTTGSRWKTCMFAAWSEPPT